MTVQATNIDVKKANRQRIYRAILRGERHAKQELASALGISLPTVAQNIRELLERGLVQETGAFASTGGRKARVVSPCPQARLAVGMDITQNHVGLVAVDLRGDILRHLRIQRPFSDDESYYRETARLVQAFVEDLSAEPAAVLGVGISVPGIVSREGNAILDSYVPGIPRRTGNGFASHLPWPSSLCNDANAAGLAETWGGGHGGIQVFLSLSNTVGGAVLSSAGFFSGDNQRAAEFGHICINQDGSRCYCGKLGCFDAYCSALVLSGHGGGRLEDFFARLESGDADCQGLFDRYLDDLAIMISNLRTAFDCPVILGGYVGAWLEPYLPRLLPRITARNTFEQGTAFLRLCRYKVEASAVGCALRYIEEFIRQV